jgi:hypothetical protein
MRADMESVPHIGKKGSLARMNMTTREEADTVRWNAWCERGIADSKRQAAIMGRLAIVIAAGLTTWLGVQFMRMG